MFIETLLILTAFLAALAAVLAFMAMRAAAKPDAVMERLALVHDATQQHPKLLRDETGRLSEAHARAASELRGEVTRLVQGFQTAQATSAATLRKELTDGQTAAADSVAASTKTLGEFQRERLDRMQIEQKTALDAVALELKAVKEAAAADQQKARDRLSEEMDKLRKENEAKLDQMRATVDEKLQGTLDKRLGESFTLVNERLEQVHKAAGEMMSIGVGVNDLKRVLTNVKSRGSWGEVQLGALLEDMLTPDQYGRQVRVRDGSAEVVDFAVHLPGTSEQGRVLLPLDCKFPHEDYDRLQAAQDLGDAALVEAAAKALERAIRVQAKSISDKYVHPPETTPFAIMYLPTEGLFAEVVRRPGLAAELSNTHRVTVAGPTTLAALLSSLKMGFQTLAIQKNASDIMQRLGEAKKAFQDYGTALDAVDKKLDEAKNKVRDVGVRHRAVSRTLRSVEAIEPAPAAKLLALPGLEEDDEAA